MAKTTHGGSTNKDVPGYFEEAQAEWDLKHSSTFIEKPKKPNVKKTTAGRSTARSAARRSSKG